MSLSVTILGAGTGIPAKDKSPAGIYVRIAGEHVLLDAGAGTLQPGNPSGSPAKRGHDVTPNGCEAGQVILGKIEPTLVSCMGAGLGPRP